MSTVKDRLVAFLAYEGVSQGRFEKSVGLSTGFVAKTGEDIRTASLKKIKEVYPHLNTTWLLTGEGEMVTVAEIPNDSVKERLINFIKYKKLSQKRFEEAVGLSNGFVNNISKGIGAEKLHKILCKFPDLNQDWLLTGEGDMLRTGTAEAQDADNDTPLGKTIKYYPNVNGSMGGITFLDDPNEATCEITIPGYADCDYAINAYGDSMYPLIKGGQIVLLAEWKERFIDWGKIYLVVTKSGYRAIKRLFPAENSCCIMCRSENEAKNPPFEIEKEDIVKCFLVKGWICRDAI